MHSLNQIISELKKFNSPNSEFYPALNKGKIDELEKKLKYKLPLDFRKFLLISNGAIINCHELYGIHDDKPFEDLFGNYIFEKDEVENPIREHLLPIYPDGMGNHQCLDLRSLSPDGEICNVIFWQHDHFYSEYEQPDIDAISFTQFLENILNNMSEHYYYDGSPK
jgi:cell wall assembly regulator SMI1